VQFSRENVLGWQSSQILGDADFALIELQEFDLFFVFGAAEYEAERSLLVRAYFQGLTAREIAEADHIPLGTVKTRLRTALIKIRRSTVGKEQ